MFNIILQHPVSHHLLADVTGVPSFMQHRFKTSLKTSTFFKKSSLKGLTTYFSLHGHHQVLKFFFWGNCFAGSTITTAHH
jgi:hypothetical protein